MHAEKNLHQDTVQGAKIDLTCKFCEKFCYNKGSKVTHEKSCSKYDKFIDGLKCLICKKSFKDRHTLIHSHLQRAHRYDIDKVTKESLSVNVISGSQSESKIDKREQNQSSISIPENEPILYQGSFLSKVCFDC